MRVQKTLQIWCKATNGMCKTDATGPGLCAMKEKLLSSHFCDFLQQPQAAELPVHSIAVIQVCPQMNFKIWLSLQLVSKLVKIFLGNQGLYHSLEGKGHCN